MANAPSLPPLIDNPLASEFFADEATGFFMGNLSITFSSARVDHKSDPGSVSRVVVGRVVLPIAARGGAGGGALRFVAENVVIRPGAFLTRRH